MALDCRTSLFFKNILTDFIEYESIESVCFGGSDENGIFDFEDEDAYYSFDQLGDIYDTYENAQNALDNY